MLLTKLLLEPEEELMSWCWNVKVIEKNDATHLDRSVPFVIVTVFLAQSINATFRVQLEKQPTSESFCSSARRFRPICILKWCDQHHQIISNPRLSWKTWKHWSSVESLPRHSIDFWSRSFRSCLKSSGLSTFLREISGNKLNVWDYHFVGVSKSNGTPKSSILIGFSIIFTIHFGVPLFLETPL